MYIYYICKPKNYLEIIVATMKMNEAVNAEKYLIDRDPLLGALIKEQGHIERPGRSDYFASLVRSIIGQQVSVAAATAIFSRYEDATLLQPAKAAKLTELQIKGIGLSKQKAGYLKDLAEHFLTNPDYSHLEKLSDEEVIADLTAIKGIGNWTAQMFLMFTLGRLDVFAPDDVGLQKAMMKLYGWDTLPPKKELEIFAERWKPYRTIACWHLWESLNNTPLKP